MTSTVTHLKELHAVLVHTLSMVERSPLFAPANRSDIRETLACPQDAYVAKMEFCKQLELSILGAVTKLYQYKKGIKRPCEDSSAAAATAAPRDVVIDLTSDENDDVDDDDDDDATTDQPPALKKRPPDDHSLCVSSPSSCENNSVLSEMSDEDEDDDVKNWFSSERLTPSLL